MRACARDTDRALQPRILLGPPLRSTGSAAAETALFARFLATSGRSDFSIALIVGYGLRPSRQRPDHDWLGRRWRSPGSRAKGFCACQGLRRRGVGMCLAISTPAVLPSVGRKTSAPRTRLTPLNTACALPCERFTSALADSPCITRGRYGSLLLHRDGLPPSTFCRSPGAPVHSIKWRHLARIPKETSVCAAKAKAADAAAIFHARVPELTASAGIKLNERHSLRRYKSRIR
jgi:hypothetical protein